MVYETIDCLLTISLNLNGKEGYFKNGNFGNLKRDGVSTMCFKLTDLVRILNVINLDWTFLGSRLKTPAKDGGQRILAFIFLYSIDKSRYKMKYKMD